mgnify:FL=1
MRKKIAIVLAVIMVSCHMNVLAENDTVNNNAAEETSTVSAETNEADEESAAVWSEEETEQDITESAEESESESEAEQSSEIREETSDGDGTIAGSETASEEESTESVSGQDSLAVAQESGEEITKALPESNIAETVQEEELSVDRSMWEEDTIFKVLIPASTRAFLDPDDLSGRGQIFSDRYEVENYGNTDVAIKIKNIEIHCESETGVSEESAVERLNVDMVWESEHDQRILHVAEGAYDEYVIWLEAAVYEGDEGNEKLGQESIGRFYFTGTVDSDPGIDWEAHEITVVFSYEIVNPANVETHDEQQEETQYTVDPVAVQDTQPEYPDSDMGTSDTIDQETVGELESSAPQEPILKESETETVEETESSGDLLSG